MNSENVIILEWWKSHICYRELAWCVSLPGISHFVSQRTAPPLTLKHVLAWTVNVVITLVISITMPHALHQHNNFSPKVTVATRDPSVQRITVFWAHLPPSTTSQAWGWGGTAWGFVGNKAANWCKLHSVLRLYPIFSLCTFGTLWFSTQNHRIQAFLLILMSVCLLPVQHH